MQSKDEQNQYIMLKIVLNRWNIIKLVRVHQGIFLINFLYN